MPPATKICRICLAVNLRLFKIEGSLRVVFEKLMNIPLNTNDGRPVAACYICYAQLKKCHRLMVTSATAETVLSHILEYSEITIKSVSQIDRLAYGLSSSLTKAKYQSYDFSSLPSMPIKIKVDPEEDVKNEFLDDIQPSPKSHDIQDVNENIFEDMSPVQSPIMYKKEDSDIGEDCLQPLNVAVNIHDMKIEVDEEDLMSKILAHSPKTSVTDNHRQSAESSGDKKKRSTQETNTYKQHQCTLCHKRYRRLGNMLKHLKSHGAGDFYQCDMCYFGCANKNKLITHLKTHTAKQEKRFKCDSCQRQFKQSQQLKKHLRTHTGEKPYQCDYCSKKFCRKEVLISHIVFIHSHTGVKNFKCQICDSDFRSRADLTRHLSVHSGSKLFSCCICNQKFTQKASLKRHRFRHTGAKPYQCSGCMEMFNRKWSLDRHFERWHTVIRNRKFGRPKKEKGVENVAFV